MRPGPATPAASFVDLSTRLPAARSGETMVLVRQRSAKSATFTSTDCRSVIRRITSLQSLRQPAAQSAQERTVEEAAMPGQPARTRARFRISPGNSPSRIASLPPASPQIIHWQALRIATYSLNPLCPRMLRRATEKHFPLVRNLWTTRLPCGKLRKSAEEFARKQPGRCRGFALADVKRIAPHAK
jgi:hypothetical protein